MARAHVTPHPKGQAVTTECYDYTRIPANGREFEQYVASVFADLGYEVELTPASGDFGADVILTEPGSRRRIAVQAKFYGSALDGAPVQEVVGALAHYGACEGWVVTNSTFTRAARQLAAENGVRLVEGTELRELVAAAEANRVTSAGASDGEGTHVWRDLDFRGLDAMPDDAGELDDVSAPGASADEAAWGRTTVMPAGGAGAAGQTTMLPGGGERWDGRTSAMSGASRAGAAGTQVSRTMPFPAVVGAPTAGPARAGAAPYAQAGEPVYTLSELAGLWGVSPAHIRRMVGEEGMPMRKTPSGRWEIGASELAAWTAEHDARVREQVARAERRERGRRTRHAVAVTLGWLVVLGLAVCAFVIVRSLLEELAPGASEGVLAQLQGLVSGLASGLAAGTGAAA